MIAWFYKWLPIIFGCHCRKDRSFHYHGKQFPICARCSGELVGIIIGIFLCFIIDYDWLMIVLLMLPMVVDGSIQALTKYESNNIKRLITGILFGIALTFCFHALNVSAINNGIKLGKWLAQYK